MDASHLTLVPSVPVWRDGRQLVVDRKFLDGLAHYRAGWSGPIRVLAWRAQADLPTHGMAHLDPALSDVQWALLEPGEAVQVQHLRGTDVVLASADDFRQLQLASLCRDQGVRCVYVIEYVPETRQQINRIESSNRCIRWRRQLFLYRMERRRLSAFAACDGLQANGLPAYEHYTHSQRLLYFDTRMARTAMPTAAALETRLARLQAGRPLHIAFSGRWIGMKGADHLLPLAAQLRDQGVACRWSIFGDGDLAAKLRQQRALLRLEAQVDLVGPLDFTTELVPRIQREVDLYVMPHRQSDPSCTYLETLGCGIPIVGYGNRAWTGLLQLGAFGLQAPIDDVKGLAGQVAALALDRVRLAALSREALRFARRHSVEHCFEQRVAHLRVVVGGSQ